MDSVPPHVSHTKEIQTAVPQPVHPSVQTEGEDPALLRVFQNVAIFQVEIHVKTISYIGKSKAALLSN